jgi:hypothetical protein
MGMVAGCRVVVCVGESCRAGESESDVGRWKLWRLGLGGIDEVQVGL